MRRLATIVLSIVIILGLGSATYAYVANQRAWWPFTNSTVSTTASNNFAELLPPDPVLYAHLDLANPSVMSRLASNAELLKNINTLKGGLQQMGNYILQSSLNASLATDTSTQAEVEGKVVQALEYLAGKKIHIGWVADAVQQTEMSSDIIIGIESKSAEEAKQTIVTLKGFLANNEANLVTKEIQINNHAVTEITHNSTPVPTATDITGQSTVLPVPTVETSTATFITNINNQLVMLTANRAAMEQVLQKSTNPALPNFKQNPQFNSLITKISGPQLGIVYLNNNKYLTAFQQPGMNTGGTEALNQALYQALAQNPMYRSHSISGITLNDKGLYSDTFMAFADPAIAQTYANAASTYVTSIPENTLYFIEGNNLNQQLGMVIGPLLQALETEAATMGDPGPVSMIREFEQANNISIQADIAPLFAKTTALTFHRNESILMPLALTVITEVQDMVRAQATMDKLTNAIVTEANTLAGIPMPAPTTENINGVTVHSFGSLDGTETLYNYGFLKDNKSLVISSAQSGIKKIIDTLAQPTTSLGQSGKYPALLKQINGANSIMYFDIKGLADAFLPFVTMAMEQEQIQIYTEQVKPLIDILNNLAGYNVVEGGMLKSVMQLQLVSQ
ncbi:MAG: DUF3352 domain-containing protein [Candidatus Abawacabacteria bacterium]|nr:DUF3352 domain-containing protein [Candidatus Abawacabacteria bacterium]